MLIDILSKMQPGEQITYADLGKRVGFVVDGSTGSLRSAMKAVQQDREFVVAVIPKLGVARLTDQQIISAAPAGTRRIFRAAKREVKKLALVRDFDKLTDDEKRTHQISTIACIKVADATSRETLKSARLTVKIDDGISLLSAIKREIR